MTQVNRYNTISEKQFNLYTPPLEVIGAALETAQKTYDRNFLFANELKNKYINALPQDRARANQLQSNWENQVDNVVKAFSGDYSKGSKDLYLLQKDIEKQYRQGGEAHAIEYNYAQVQDSMKRNKERLAKGDIKQVQYDALYNYFDKNYTGVRKQEDGSWAVANIPELANAVDGSKLADEATKGLKPRTVKRSREYKKDGRIYNEVYEQSVIDPQEVQDAISGSLYANEGYINYATQLAQLTGQDPNAIIGRELAANVAAFGPTRSGVFNDSQELKSQVDPFALERLRYQHDINLAQAKGEIEMPGQGPSMRMIANVNNENSKFRPLNIEGGFIAASGGMSMNNTPFTPSLGMSSAVNPGKILPKASVDQVLKGGQSAYPNVDVNLLAAVKAQNPKFNDTQILETYNRSLTKQNYGEGVYMDAYRNSDTGQEAARLNIPYLQSGVSNAYFLDAAGNKRSLTVKEKQAYYSQLWDTDKNAPRVASLGTTMTFSGDVPYGQVFPVAGGYLVLASNNEVVNQYNTKLRPAAFNFIGEARNAGDQFEVIMSNQRQGIQGVKVPTNDPKRMKDENGLPVTTFDIRYLATNPDGSVKMVRGKDGKEVPDFFTTPDGNGGFRYSSPYDMERLLGGDLGRLDIPRNTISKSKDYNSPYERN